MNNNNTLNILDNAVKDTMQSYLEKKGEVKSPSYYCGAIKQFIVNFNDPRRANGFTKSNGARDNVNSLTKENVYAELLKNIVKLKAFREDYGQRQALAVSDYFSRDMHPLEKDEWLFRQLMYYPLEGIDEMMKRNDDIMNGLIGSFVESRYYSNNKDNIDNTMLNEDEQECLDRINGYYNTHRYRY